MKRWGFARLDGGSPPPGRLPRSWSADSWRDWYVHWRGTSTARSRDACPATGGFALVSYRLRTGSIQARHQCVMCGRVMSSSLPYTEAEAAQFPRAKDGVSDQPCERCGATEGVERHHWAPRSVFGDDEADRWPIALLCRPCHREWHRKMGAR
jgi:5-methylcytosine-specific restriction endonuclease McrA